MVEYIGDAIREEVRAISAVAGQNITVIDLMEP
jgi:hypothetical protein